MSFYLAGIVSRPGLNGEAVTITRRLEHERVAVRLRNGTSISVKVANVRGIQIPEIPKEMKEALMKKGGVQVFRKVREKRTPTSYDHMKAEFDRREADGNETFVVRIKLLPPAFCEAVYECYHHGPHRRLDTKLAQYTVGKGNVSITGHMDPKEKKGLLRTLSAIKKGWPPYYCSTHCNKMKALIAGLDEKGMMDKIDEFATNKSWSQRVLINGLTFSGIGNVSTRARQVLAEGDMKSFLMWQLEDNVMLLDTFYMSWSKDEACFHYEDSKEEPWMEQLGDVCRGDCDTVSVEVCIRGMRYYADIILCDDDTFWMINADGDEQKVHNKSSSEPSKFLLALTGFEIDCYREFARFDSKMYSGTRLTTPEELRLRQTISMRRRSGAKCTRCGCREEMTTLRDLPGPYGKWNMHNYLALALCEYCRGGHCDACIKLCKDKRAEEDATREKAAKDLALQQLISETNLTVGKQKIKKTSAPAQTAQPPKPKIETTYEEEGVTKTKKQKAKLSRKYKNELRERRRLEQKTERAVALPLKDDEVEDEDSVEKEAPKKSPKKSPKKPSKKSVLLPSPDLDLACHLQANLWSSTLKYSEVKVAE